MTTGEDESQAILVVEPAILPDSVGCGVTHLSVALDLPVPPKSPIPDLSIPTPPPKA